MFRKTCGMERLYDFCINYSSVPFIIGAAAFYTTYYYLWVGKVGILILPPAPQASVLCGFCIPF